jgi:hypothetical protein
VQRFTELFSSKFSLWCAEEPLVELANMSLEVEPGAEVELLPFLAGGPKPREGVEPPPFLAGEAKPREGLELPPFLAGEARPREGVELLPFLVGAARPREGVELPPFLAGGARPPTSSSSEDSARFFGIPSGHLLPQHFRAY